MCTQCLENDRSYEAASQSNVALLKKVTGVNTMLPALHRSVTSPEIFMWDLQVCQL